jgi:hypothetical protein
MINDNRREIKIWEEYNKIWTFKGEKFLRRDEIFGSLQQMESSQGEIMIE